MSYNDIPQEIKIVNQWVARTDKIPISPITLCGANSVDNRTWGSFEQVISANGKPCTYKDLKTKELKNGVVNGIGFVFAPPYCGIDIDHCIDKNTGEICSEALDIIAIMDSYTEFSPSGTGFHIIYKGEIHSDWRKKIANALGEGIHLEMYQKGRYFTITGDIYENHTDIREAENAAQTVYKAYAEVNKNRIETTKIRPLPSYNNSSLSDNRIVELATKSNKAFPALWRGDFGNYGSQSEADLALCNILAFYADGSTQVDNLFRQSGLMREKWDEKHGAKTYGEITIEKAINNQKSHYDPHYYRSRAVDDFKIEISNSKQESEALFSKLTYDEIRKYKVDDSGDIENGFYIPTENDFDYEVALNSAKNNVLDKRVMDFIRNLDSIEEIQDFQYEILDFAKNQKKKTELSNFIKTAILQLKKRQKEYEQAELIEKYKEQRSERQSKLPDWAYLDKKDRPRIDERLYIEHLINECGEVRCWNGKLRTLKGLFRDNEALNLIQNEISQVINYKIANTACDILKALKNHCYCEEPPLDRRHIHFQNGTLKVDDKGLFTVFSEQKEFCRNRLATNYNFNAPEPKLFFKYLNDLYTPEQIRTIKQYLGYCFIPTNRLQICLHIYGLGGSGKSQLGGIIARIFGEENCTIDKISKLGKNFGAANIENRLLFIDDDVTEQALEKTEFFKSIVSAPDDVKQEFEAKFKQENRIIPYSRFLTFGNFTFRSLYDNTEGFYRRILVLECKPAPIDRKRIRGLDEKIFRNEAEGIVKWCIEGLNDLIKNNWKLYVSDIVKAHSEKLKYSDDSIMQYMNESRNLLRGADFRLATCDLYQDYSQFCDDNSLTAVKQKTFAQTLKERANQYKIAPTTHTRKINDKKEVRGFMGIALKDTSGIY